MCFPRGDLSKCLGMQTKHLHKWLKIMESWKWVSFLLSFSRIRITIYQGPRYQGPKPDFPCRKREQNGHKVRDFSDVDRKSYLATTLTSTDQMPSSLERGSLGLASDATDAISRFGTAVWPWFLERLASAFRDWRTMSRRQAHAKAAPIVMLEGCVLASRVFNCCFLICYVQLVRLYDPITSELDGSGSSKMVSTDPFLILSKRFTQDCRLVISSQSNGSSCSSVIQARRSITNYFLNVTVVAMLM